MKLRPIQTHSALIVYKSSCIALMILSGVMFGLSTDPAFHDHERVLIISCAVFTDIIAYFIMHALWTGRAKRRGEAYLK